MSRSQASLKKKSDVGLVWMHRKGLSLRTEKER